MSSPNVFFKNVILFRYQAALKSTVSLCAEKEMHTFDQNMSFSGKRRVT